jgi:hypothetical protein
VDIGGTIVAHTLAGCGHFMTEEQPEFVVEHILALTAKTSRMKTRLSGISEQIGE